ncbi:MAG TPA: magnesium chelatase ATPase subunit D, partial [Alphaproteobacteria bacterium]|nr:magnesium chelatase ATPase subunit D [Alphaproteobacteria bacterium]
RDQAKEDASAMARQFRAEGISSMVVDTGRRASTDLKELASMMAGRYQILPNARADQLSQMVGDALRPRSIA